MLIFWTFLSDLGCKVTDYLWDTQVFQTFFDIKSKKKIIIARMRLHEDMLCRTNPMQGCTSWCGIWMMSIVVEADAATPLHSTFANTLVIIAKLSNDVECRVLAELADIRHWQYFLINNPAKLNVFNNKAKRLLQDCHSYDSRLP